MKAKEQLEKISRMDFERPIGKMRDVASGFGVDLGDELVKEQFQELQERNLKDIRIWLRKNGWKDIKRRRKKRERRGEGRTDIAQEMILEQAVENMNTDSEVADKVLPSRAYRLGEQVGESGHQGRAGRVRGPRAAGAPEQAEGGGLVIV